MVAAFMHVKPKHKSCKTDCHENIDVGNLYGNWEYCLDAMSMMSNCVWGKGGDHVVPPNI